jgi:serine/threonine protein kinase/Tol biopolymer transport system component
MTPDRSQQIMEIFHAAVARDTAGREAFLREACGEDAALRAEVDALLAAHRDAGSFGKHAVQLSPSVIKTLEPGQSLGPYRIESLLGAGGMGEVYRAKDTRLDRHVAIKVLLRHIAADSDSRQRFEREARAVASLNHPHICTLHDIGAEDEVDYLVMEYLEGETLASRLAKGRLPMDQVLRHGIAVAGALATAHSRRIIHRDLKPGNIMITKTGVKVLDFGLAKFLRPEHVTAEQAETLAVTGAILGTPGYMAPEQLEGKECDARTDIFALGLLLCEMATGRRATAGEPPLQELPPHFGHVVQHCLARDEASRWQSASDVKLALEWNGTLQIEPPRRATRPADRSLVRLRVDLGPDAVPGLRTTAVLSPDGRRLAFLARGTDGRQRLATRLLEHAQPTLLAGTENAQDPFFSPNGEWVGFFGDNKLKRVSVKGGSPVILCEAPNDRGASWADDDTIIMAPHIYGGLFRVSAGGGTPQPLTSLQEGEVAHAWPQILPGGQMVLFTGGTFVSPNIQVFSLATSQTKVVAGPGYHGRYLPSRHVVYVHQSTLFAVPFDIESLEPRGVPVPLLDDVADDAGDRTAHFNFAQNGTLVYLSGKAVTSARTIAWMERSGKTEPLLDTPGRYSYLSPSPDGKRLAFASGFPDDHIWVLDLQRGRPSRLTFATTGNIWPQWAPDGQHLVFSAQNGRGVGRTLWWIRADGAGEPQRLLESDDELHPSSVSPDGGHVAIHQRSAETLYDIVMLPLDASDPEHPRPGTPEVFLRTPVNEWGAVFSPNGRWIAYGSEESGILEIYVKPFRGPGGPWLVSSGSGISGVMAYWPRHGQALYYLSSDKHIMEVAYAEEGNSFVPEGPRPWSDVTIPFASFNLSPDGARAIIVVPVDPGRERRDLHVTFLLNFFDELRRRVPVGSKASR